MYTGSFVLVLHSHLPYVLYHGRWPHGTDWLTEAAAESYIPILNALYELLEEGKKPKLTIGITPVLAEQLSSEIFKKDFDEYLSMKVSAAENDRDYFGRIGRSRLEATAVFWADYYRNIQKSFQERYQKDLIKAFRKLLEMEVLDIITCGATHGYFPLLGEDYSINAQVKTAVATHKKHFHEKPEGIWLPESAYRPAYKWKRPVESAAGTEAYDRKGVEEFLKANGIKYTFTDSHMLKGGKAIGIYVDRFEGLKLLMKQYEKEVNFKEMKDLSQYGIYSIGEHESREDAVYVFTRDPATGLQVWSGEHGYPGDGNYLDFHKKHYPGGLRYWKVTSAKCDLGNKEEYCPEDVESRIRENADHFMWLIKTKLKEHYEATGENGVLTAPYDTELFGHWWFEGPRFLKALLGNLSDDDEVKLSDARDEVKSIKNIVKISLPEGSWGEGGYHFIWLNENTQWTWKDIYEDEMLFKKILEKAGENMPEKLEDVLKQAARELLLLQSSDWQFLISTFAARDYAEMRFSNHHNDFRRLMVIAEKELEGKDITPEDNEFFSECKQRDSLFGDIKLKWFRV